MNTETPEPKLEDYPCRTADTIRYGDTDRQGHVNNAAFATFCETGRVTLLHPGEVPVAPPGTSFVIARLTIDFRAEITWPGTVDVGTRIMKVGRSSLTVAQGLFQRGRCVATSESVIVHVDDATRKSRPLSPEILAGLEIARLPE